MVKIRVTPIVPEPYNLRELEPTIKATMYSKTIPDLKRMFKKTVATWENKPEFSGEIKNRPNSISSLVFPSGQNVDQYSIVSLGSPRHPIPKQPGRIKFQTGYAAKTRVGSISSFPGGKFGPFVTARQVDHPGFEGRRFNEFIAKEYEPTFQKDMQKAINEWVRRA